MRLIPKEVDAELQPLNESFIYPVIANLSLTEIDEAVFLFVLDQATDCGQMPHDMFTKYTATATNFIQEVVEGLEARKKKHNCFLG